MTWWFNFVVFTNVGHDLFDLELKNAWLLVQDMNFKPKLTCLTVKHIRLDDRNLTELNKFFPNL